MKPASARRAAMDVLEAVLRQNRPLDEALDSIHTLSDRRDRALAHRLAATVLRRHGQLSALIDGLVETPLRQGPARLALLLGAAQLLFTRIPDHAAVAGSVSLLTADRSVGLKSLVNAVLRRIARDRDALKAGDLLPDPIINLPDWLRCSWIETFGSDAVEAIAAVLAEEPPLDLTVKRLSERPDLIDCFRASGYTAVAIGCASIRLTDARLVSALPGYDIGRWWVQDIAAAVPAQLIDPAPGRRIIDLCAAPGGKTAQLAAAGAAVEAVDCSPKRLSRLRDNMERLGLTVRTTEADATKWMPEAPADALLLDAPCSATGAARRHPDIFHLKRSPDLSDRIAMQDRLLDRAATMIRPGGLLVYSTCSPQPEEGSIRIERFLGTHPNFRRRPLSQPELDATFATGLTEDGDLLTHPAMLTPGGMDGFYVARLEKTS